MLRRYGSASVTARTVIAGLRAAIERHRSGDLAETTRDLLQESVMRGKLAREDLARPVQPHPAVALADAEAPADLAGGQAIDCLQLEDLPQRCRQASDRLP